MRARLLACGLSILAGSAAAAPNYDNAFCRAYAGAAIASTAEAERLGCGYVGARWSNKFNDQYDWCTTWGRDTGRIALFENNTRQNDVAKCFAQHEGLADKAPPVVTPWGDGLYPQPATMEKFCENYEYIVNEQVNAASKLERDHPACKTIFKMGTYGYGRADRWDMGMGFQVAVCMQGGADTGRYTANETNARSEAIVSCQKLVRDTTPPPPPPKPKYTPVSHLAVGKLGTGFGGVWGSTTSDGGDYKLTLRVQEGAVTGTVEEKDPQYNGVINGRVDGNKLAFTFTQTASGATGSGTFTLSANGRTFDGNYVADSDKQKTYTWNGVRESNEAPAVAPDPPVPAPAPPPAAVQGATATVTADVDLYQSPGGEGNPIGMLKERDQVPFGGCRDDGWCEVTGKGWVWGEFLKR